MNTELLKKLMKIPSVSGREEKIRNVIKSEMNGFCDEIYTDNLGNLICRKKGDGKKLMLAAHMDEIGFFATYIEDSGLIRITPVGGIDFKSAAYTNVVFENGTFGIIVPNDGLENADISKSEKYYIDIGAASKKQAEKHVKIGDFAVCTPDIKKLCQKRYVGRPFDNRIGVYALIECAKKLTDVSNDTYFVFTAQEEVGCRGAMTAAFTIAPDYAIAVDVTSTGDTPGADTMAVKLGNGTAIKLRDQSVICDFEFVTKLKELANTNKIPYQLEILKHGGTDTSSMQKTGAGSRAAALSVPTRHIHTSTEMIDMKDTDATVSLLCALCKTAL